MRKLARKLASDEELPAQIRPEDLHDYLEQSNIPVINIREMTMRVS